MNPTSVLQVVAVILGVVAGSMWMWGPNRNVPIAMLLFGLAFVNLVLLLT